MSSHGLAFRQQKTCLMFLVYIWNEWANMHCGRLNFWCVQTEMLWHICFKKSNTQYFSNVQNTLLFYSRKICANINLCIYVIKESKQIHTFSHIHIFTEQSGHCPFFLWRSNLLYKCNQPMFMLSIESPSTFSFCDIFP